MEETKLTQTPVYLDKDKKQKVKELAKRSRLPITRWIETAIDSKIKKEDK